MIERIVPPALFGIQATVVYAAIATREYTVSSLDTTAIVIAVISAVPPTTVAWLAYRTAGHARDLGAENKEKIVKVGKDLDGRMTQLLETTSRDQRAQGVVEGRGEQAQLQVQAANPPPATEPMEVIVVPDENAPLPVVVVHPEEKKP